MLISPLLVVSVVRKVAITGSPLVEINKSFYFSDIFHSFFFSFVCFLSIELLFGKKFFIHICAASLILNSILVPRFHRLKLWAIYVKSNKVHVPVHSGPVALLVDRWLQDVAFFPLCFAIP